MRPAPLEAKQAGGHGSHEVEETDVYGMAETETPPWIHGPLVSVPEAQSALAVPTLAACLAPFLCIPSVAPAPPSQVSTATFFLILTQGYIY